MPHEKIDKVRAKFRCNSVTDYGGQKSINMTAIGGREGENAHFAKATPSGTLQMNIDADVPASDYFKPGKDYYLEFSEA